jgi:tight adherence protein B
VTGAGVLAVGLAAAAGAVQPGARAVVLQRVSAARPDLRQRRRAAALPWWVPVPVVAAAVGWSGRSVVLGAAAGLAVLAGGRAVSARATRRRAAVRRAAAVDLLASLAAELRGGAAPRAALAAAAAPRHPAVAAAARSPASDLVRVLAAADDGVGLLADLAVAWRLVEITGARLAGPASRLVESARADEAVRREVAAQLAGPRATALLLALLPCSGVLLGAGLGADPVGFLLATEPGRLCLLAGASLMAAGMTWTEAIVTRAEGP